MTAPACATVPAFVPTGAKRLAGKIAGLVPPRSGAQRRADIASE